MRATTNENARRQPGAGDTATQTTTSEGYHKTSNGLLKRSNSRTV